jgi:hypothetical protein
VVELLDEEGGIGGRGKKRQRGEIGEKGRQGKLVRGANGDALGHFL